jgi:hypothetical protein
MQNIVLITRDNGEQVTGVSVFLCNRKECRCSLRGTESVHPARQKIVDMVIAFDRKQKKNAVEAEILKD